MSRKNAKSMVLFIGLLAVAMMAPSLSAQAMTPPVGSRSQAHHAEYHRVRSVGVTPTISLAGTVVPFREVTLAAQWPGSVEYVAGREGERFERGDLLVALNDDELLAQRRDAEAQLRNAEAVLRNADVQYSRELYAPYSLNRSFGGMGMPTLMDYFFTRPFSGLVGNSSPYLERHADLYTFGTQVEQARNALLSARFRILRMDAKLSDTRSHAPFNGVIVSKLAEMGDTVQPGQPLVKFADMSLLEIQVNAPARLVSGLETLKRRRLAVLASLDAGERNIRVGVAHVFPVADAQRHTVTVKFNLPPGTQARPGMYATVRVPDVGESRQNRIVIPKSAVVNRGSLPGVYLRTSKEASPLRFIRLGESFNREWVVVLSGLNDDDEILRNAGSERSPWPTGTSRPREPHGDVSQSPANDLPPGQSR